MSSAEFIALSTPRLSLVALALEHAPAVLAYASDPEVSDATAAPRHASLSDSRRFIARALVGYATGGYYEWALLRRSDQAFMGSCGFGAVERSAQIAEIGYELGKPYWGQGYATEAMAAVCEFGFAQLGLQGIEALALPSNLASLRVMAKLGMRHVGTRRQDADSETVTVYRIERERWRR